MKLKLFENLGWRLSLTLATIFLLFSIICISLLVISSRSYEQEVSQKMHVKLAQFVVDHYSFFNNGKPDFAAAEHTFHDLMLMGPNFEFYLLDTEGKILAYSAKPGTVVRETVDVTPFNNWKANLSEHGYTVNDDPRDTLGKKVFSVAPIFEEEQQRGYLYAVIGSQIRDELEQQLLQSRIMRWGIIVFGLLSIFTLLVILFVVSVTTRPIRKLTKQIKNIRQFGFSRKGFSQNSSGLEDNINQLTCWKADSHNDIHILGDTFKMALDNLLAEYKNVVSVDELRKELLSHVSHDLRTPLASLLGYLETWEIHKESATNEKRDEYIAIAKKNAQQISNLVEQLFELAHLDGDNVQVNIERFSIAELIQDVLHKFKIQAERKNIQLSVVPQDSTISVRADIEKMERVITNLVENALRHTPDNGSITVRIEKGSSFVSLQVADTGIGIPEQDLPHIFDAHYKAGNSVRENTAHGGLGLAITKKLLELHESTIGVSSKINKGTTFSFALPSA